MSGRLAGIACHALCSGKEALWCHVCNWKCGKRLGWVLQDVVLGGINSYVAGLPPSGQQGDYKIVVFTGVLQGHALGP